MFNKDLFQTVFGGKDLTADLALVEFESCVVGWPRRQAPSLIRLHLNSYNLIILSRCLAIRK
jgi:hypothetical protein